MKRGREDVEKQKALFMLSRAGSHMGRSYYESKSDEAGRISRAIREGKKLIKILPMNRKLSVWIEIIKLRIRLMKVRRDL